MLFFSCYTTLGNTSNEDYKKYNTIIKNNENITTVKELKSTFNKLRKTENNPTIVNLIYLLFNAKIIALHKDNINDHSTNLYKKALKLAEKTKNEDLILLANTYTGFYFYTYSDIINAYPYFVKSSRILDEKENYQFINSADIFKKNAYFFSFVEDNEKSLNYLVLALRCTSKNSEDFSNILNGIAQYYIKFKNFEKAKSFLFKTLIYSQNRNTIRYAKALGDLALIYKEQKNHQKAIEYLKKDIVISTAINEDRNIIYAKILLSKIYLETKDYLAAEKNLKEAQLLTKNKPYLNSFCYEINEILLQLSIINHQEKDELKYRRILSDLETKLADKDGEHVITKINLELQKNNIQYQLEAEKINKEKETLKNNALLIFLFLFILCIIFMYLYFKNNLNEQKDNYNNNVLKLIIQKNKSEKKLFEKMDSLEVYKDYLIKKNNEIDHLKSEIKLINTTKNPYFEEKSFELTRLLQSHLMTDESWTNFKNVFIKEQNDYYIFLITKFPNLTESNLRIIFLFKLGLNNTQVAHLLGVTVDAVKKAKQRLKKKYGEGYDLILPKKEAQL